MAVVAGCQQRISTAVPTEEELDVWTEVFLIEAALQDFSGLTKDSLAERYYDQLYDRYGLDEVALSDLRQRYTEDVRLFEIMSDSVEARLQRSQEDPSALLNPGVM